MVVSEAGKWGEWGEVGKRVQTFGSKINKVRGSNVQNGDYS